MGVDSGLPDFRGTEGFWQAYPALGRSRIRFEAIANPQSFRSDPKLAWGFYGHRLNLYRRTVPHEGYRLLREIAGQLPGGAFVFTSNVDGQFARAGFDLNRIVECHGSIHHLQCLANCAGEIWEAEHFVPEVDEERCHLLSEPPTCPRCGRLARPNILMFGDYDWEGARTEEQQEGLRAWLDAVRNPVVIELGAGTAVPTVRLVGESLGVPMIRINPMESRVYGEGNVAIRSSALEAISGIVRELEKMGFM